MKTDKIDNTLICEDCGKISNDICAYCLRCTEHCDLDPHYHTPDRTHGSVECGLPFWQHYEYCVNRLRGEALVKALARHDEAT